MLALAPFSWAGAVAAQGQERDFGPGRGEPGRGLTGTVSAPDGQGVAGASVEVRPAAGRGRLRTTQSDSAGNWRIGGLSGGVWRIEISAPGYQSARGRVEVRAGRGRVDTTLEIDADRVVRGWLEEANELLTQGEAARAHELYERALSVVPLPQSPAIHRALARTHFLLGRTDEAVRSLQRALLMNPQDAEARQLLPALLANAGRGAEGLEWLELLDTEGASAAGAAAFAVEVPERALDRGVSGRFRTRVERASPHATDERLLSALGDWERLGVEPGAPWRPAEESFEVFVPEPEASRRPGVLVWISPTPRGGLPDPAMTAVLESRQMIWIGPNRAGNSRPRADRIRLALDAVAALRRSHDVDPQRIYVGGYSGGGRMASILAIHFADVFAGGIYFMGVDFYREVPKADQPGTSWGPILQPPTEAAKREIQRSSRFVFITGAHDFNRAQTWAYRDAYVADGFDRVHLIEIPRAGHYHGFKAAELAEALAFLDGERAADAPEGTPE